MKIRQKDILITYSMFCDECGTDEDYYGDKDKSNAENLSSAKLFFHEGGWRRSGDEIFCSECANNGYKVHNKRGPKLCTGRFNTRERLVDAVHCYYWASEGVKVSHVARCVGVSEGLVASILKNEKPAYDYHRDFMERRLGK